MRESSSDINQDEARKKLVKNDETITKKNQKKWNLHLVVILFTFRLLMKVWFHLLMTISKVYYDPVKWLEWNFLLKQLTLSWQKSLSYRNKYIDLQSKSVDWFLYDRDLCHERVNDILFISRFWCSTADRYMFVIKENFDTSPFLPYPVGTFFGCKNRINDYKLVRIQMWWYRFIVNPRSLSS